MSLTIIVLAKILERHNFGEDFLIYYICNFTDSFCLSVSVNFVVLFFNQK